MNTNLAFEKPPSVSIDQKISNDLVKQVRKLRWIGMDDEARVLQVALGHIQAVDVVLGTPPETD
jgi:hypothetical protein